jgi:hypothetical protein
VTGLGLTSDVLKKWVSADGRLKHPPEYLNRLPGYAENRAQLRDAFQRLGHAEIAKKLPEPSARRLEKITAGTVADALDKVAKNPSSRSLASVSRDVGVGNDLLLRYIRPGAGGLAVPA